MDRTAAVHFACLVAGTLLIAIAGASAALGGVRLEGAGISISATDPLDPLYQGLVLAVIAFIVRTRRKEIVALLLLLTVSVAIAASASRAVGDGAEYAAMALSAAERGRPWVLAEERDALNRRLTSEPGYERSINPVDQETGRVEFLHFWLYSLVAAPFVALTTLADIPFNYGFAALNFVCFAILTAVLLKRNQPTLAALCVLGPALWWVDKAHPEVMLFTALVIGVLVLRERPLAAMACLGLATAQNPAGIVVLVPAALDVVMRLKNRTALGATLTGFGIAAVHPLYYWLGRGTASPLQSAVSADFHGVRALATPLIDPNLGIAFHAPILFALFIAGAAVTRERRSIWLWAAIAGLLYVFGTVINVNHGGTPGISRYALWIVAVSIPFVAAAVNAIHARAPLLGSFVVILSVAQASYAFQPKWDERGYVTPTRAAAWLWMNAPSWDSPLPEVFAERLSGMDSDAPVPIASPACKKVLITGMGDGAAWPWPCPPVQTPPYCAAQGALCYANRTRGGYEFVTAPRQAEFHRSHDPGAWTLDTMGSFLSLRDRVGSHWRVESPVDVARFVNFVADTRVVRVVTGEHGRALLLLNNKSTPGLVSVQVGQPVVLERYSTEGALTLQETRTLQVGANVITLPSRASLLVFLPPGRD